MGITVKYWIVILTELKIDGTYRSPKIRKGELVKNPLSQKLESLPWKIRVQIGISFGLD